jgi:hypothetical protein
MCIEIQKERMTIREVSRALREMVVPKEHEDEVYAHIERSYGIEEVVNEMFILASEEDSREPRNR